MLKLKKSLGQNLLIDKNIINKIVNIEQLCNQRIFEVGPGSGNLTDYIYKKNPKSIFLVEKDTRFCEILKNKFNGNEKIKILNNDILKYDLNNHRESKVVVFGNLPYNISTQILANFIKVNFWPPFYKKIIFMFQNEVADRILAKPNTKDYSRISILANFKLEVIDHFKISRKWFYPSPKIDSKIIVFRPREKIDYKINKIENLEEITKIFFSNKRKMINKVFSKLFKNHLELAKKLSINLKSRPSELSFDNYYRLTEFYEKSKKN